MTNFQKWMLPLLLLPSATAGARDLTVVDNLPHGVIVRPVAANAARVQVEAVAFGILRVTTHLDGDFSRAPSLMRTDAGMPPVVEITRAGSHITMRAPGIQDARSEVIWEGEIASQHAGRHTLCWTIIGGKKTLNAMVNPA